MFLKKGNAQDALAHVYSPNKIYHWGIPSVPICHVTMVDFDLAISECLHEDGHVTWQRTAENTYQRVIEDTEAELT